MMTSLAIQEDHNLCVDKFVVLSNHIEQITFVHFNTSVDSVSHRAVVCNEYLIVVGGRQMVKEQLLDAVNCFVWKWVIVFF